MILQRLFNIFSSICYLTLMTGTFIRLLLLSFLLFIQHASSANRCKPDRPIPSKAAHNQHPFFSPAGQPGSEKIAADCLSFSAGSILVVHTNREPAADNSQQLAVSHVSCDSSIRGFGASRSTYSGFLTLIYPAHYFW